MTKTRIHASVQPLLHGVQWNGGLWGNQLELTRNTTIPSIWRSLSNAEISPGWHNFLIASGQCDGSHDGPPFLDGDIYKWVEAASSLLQTRRDPDTDTLIKEITETIASVQREDGYLHTATIIAERQGEDQQALGDRFNFETYNLGHLISAMVRRYHESNNENYLTIAVKAADFLENLAHNDKETLARNAICPSHYMAVIELYRATGDHRYLALARTFLEVRETFRGGDDNQDRISVYEQDRIVGHSVRANYLYAGLADMLLESEDDELKQVLEKLWDDAVESKIYITGGCGALYDGASPDGFPEQTEISRVHQAYGRPYQLPNTTAHNETCANIGMMLWSERMLALTGEAKYADLIETIAYNALLASISLDGKRFYYTNPLRQVRQLPYPLRMPGDTGRTPVPPPPPSDERMRTEYMSVFCCPPNIARTLAQFHERAIGYTDEGVWLYQYASLNASLTLTDGTFAFSVETDYPWDGVIRITVEKAPTRNLSVNCRVPAWCSGASLSVNGSELESIEPGFVTVHRTWKPGDVLELNLPMEAQLIRSHRLAEELTNQVAVQRGPIVYCLESSDLPAEIKLEEVAIPRTSELIARRDYLADREIVSIQADAVRLPPPPDASLYAPLQPSTQPLSSFPIRLIPYFVWGNRGPSEMSVWLPLVW